MARKAARRREDGTVRQLPSGRWQARYWDEEARGQRPAPQTFDTKLDAVAWLDRGDRGAGPAVEVDPLFSDYAAAWLRSRPLKPRTVAGYELLLRDYLLPAFGDRRLRSITEPQVSAWWAAFDRSKETRRKHAYTLLSSILKAATDAGVLDRSPCRVARATVVEVRHQPVLPNAEQVEALAALMPERHRMALLLSAWCGLRVGEVTALRRRDVDEAYRVRVARAVVKVDGHFLEQTPKSRAGVRTVALPPRYASTLAEHLGRFVGPDPDALLFPALHGGYLAPTSLYPAFYRARAAVGLPTLRWHDLRHFGATEAARAGATLAQLQRRLGHSTVAAAMRYQHATQADDDALAARL